MTKIQAIHPGEILKEEFLIPFKITEYRLAKDINVGAIRINQIIKAKRSISTNTALRLGKYFGTSAEFWANLQTKYDLEIESDKLGDKLETEITFRIKDRQSK